MFAIPLVTFALIWAGLVSRVKADLGVRSGFLLACIIWGSVVVVLTEGLSAVGQISSAALSLGWVLAALAAWFVSRESLCQQIAGAVRVIPQRLFEFKTRSTPLDRVVLGLTIGVLFVVALTAWMAAPNTWDSLTYHMARVSHWQQNRTVAHFPTNIPRQNFFQPFAEWMILHFQVLSGTDRLANFVQWFAMVMSVVGVSAIAREFKASPRAQIFAAFFCATIPMGILQGSSTQNDYVTAGWVVAFVYFGLRWKDRGGSVNALAMAAALGLGVLTKGMMLIFVSPFLVWFVSARVRQNALQALGGLVLIVGIACLLNANYFYRNAQTSGHIFGSEEETKTLGNDQMTPALLASNVLRNLGLHMATSSKPLNRLTERAMQVAHDRLGVSLTEPATTYGLALFHVEVSTHEDAAGNFCQMMFIWAALIWLMVRRNKEDAPALICAGVLAASFLLFNAIAKWTPSASRYHLAYFVMFSPVVAVALSRGFQERAAAYLIALAVLTATACPYLFRNSTRKLYSSKATVFSTPRLTQYFAADKNYQRPYAEALAKAAADDCRQIGLRIGGNSWEYSFWALAREQKLNIRFEHVDVPPANPLKYPLGDFPACAIIETGRGTPPDGKIVWQDREYVPVWDMPPVKVYAPQTHK